MNSTSRSKSGSASGRAGGWRGVGPPFRPPRGFTSVGGRRGVGSPFRPPRGFTRSAMRMGSRRLGATDIASLLLESAVVSSGVRAADGCDWGRARRRAPWRAERQPHTPLTDWWWLKESLLRASRLRFARRGARCEVERKTPYPADRLVGLKGVLPRASRLRFVYASAQCEVEREPRIPRIDQRVEDLPLFEHSGKLIVGSWPQNSNRPPPHQTRSLLHRGVLADSGRARHGGVTMPSDSSAGKALSRSHSPRICQLTNRTGTKEPPNPQPPQKSYAAPGPKAANTPRCTMPDQTRHPPAHDARTKPTTSTAGERFEIHAPPRFRATRRTPRISILKYVSGNQRRMRWIQRVLPWVSSMKRGFSTAL